MASSHIDVTGQSNRGNAKLRSNIDSLQRYMDDSRQMKAIIDAASLDSDWEGLGEFLGKSAEEAEIIYNLFVGMWNTLAENGAISQYLSRLG